MLQSELGFAVIRIRSKSVLRIEKNSIDKAVRAKRLQTENGSCEFDSCGPDQTLVCSGAAGKPREPNL